MDPLGCSTSISTLHTQQLKHSLKGSNGAVGVELGKGEEVDEVERLIGLFTDYSRFSYKYDVHRHIVIRFS